MTVLTVAALAVSVSFFISGAVLWAMLIWRGPQGCVLRQIPERPELRDVDDWEQ